MGFYIDTQGRKPRSVIADALDELDFEGPFVTERSHEACVTERSQQDEQKNPCVGLPACLQTARQPSILSSADSEAVPSRHPHWVAFLVTGEIPYKQPPPAPTLGRPPTTGKPCSPSAGP